MKNATQITFAFQDPPDSGENPSVGVRIKKLKKAAGEVAKDQQLPEAKAGSLDDAAESAINQGALITPDSATDEAPSINQGALITPDSVTDNTSSINQGVLISPESVALEESSINDDLSNEPGESIISSERVAAVNQFESGQTPANFSELTTDAPLSDAGKSTDAVRGIQADEPGSTEAAITASDEILDLRPITQTNPQPPTDAESIIDGDDGDATYTSVESIQKASKSTRGRKSLKTIDEGADLINIPPDDILFQKQYYAIGEVAEMFHVNQSLLRFWETEFDIIQPRKNRKGDRHFRPVDIKNLLLIHDLLRRRKLTIEGAKDFLKKNKRSPERFAMIQSLQRIKGFILEIKATL